MTQKEINSQYSPTQIEDKWYAYWMEHGFFNSTVDTDKKPYTIVIPPPNVTGILHMGHMLNNTLQDVLVRKARMSGFNACWVPGTDHASIATEAKVVKWVQEKGLSKQDLGREKFLEYAWEWTDKHGGVILEQLKKLGASCDWNRTKFTLDDDLSESVIQVFIDLYNEGLIYRGTRIINWDPEAKTNISDEEVIYVEKNGQLYYLKYQVEGTDDYVVVATTRPETIFGDVAVCFHPEDERYTHLQGKKLIVPVVNRSVPVIYDDYIDLEFGTGALKVTPANDINDYELGQKHQLPTIEIFHDDASLNENGLHYKGKDRFVVRKEIIKELDSKNLLEKVENYTNKVGTSERTGAVIEPKISEQWYLKIKDLAKPALDIVLNDQLHFYPKHFKNTYKHWMENITDWNISRQLWWGHQIPVYYYHETEFVVAKSKQDALEQLAQKGITLQEDDLSQDPDVLDTWFSSWLWPISVFNGINDPDNEEFQYYYPTQDLVTGPDIIFFWVARMIMAGLHFKQEKPFDNVYFTGIVRDKQGRKMSKQLGNSPDALQLIEEFGADGVRVGLMMSTSAGNDLKFDEALCLQGRNFANKLWNSFRLISGWELTDVPSSQVEKDAIEWINHRVQQVLEEIEDHFSKFRLSDALLSIYKLIWDDYCSWFLESIKPGFNQPISQETYEKAVSIFEDVLKMLHPFMPFITEEIWQNIKERTPQEAIVISDYPSISTYNGALIKEFSQAQELVSQIRNYRQQKGLSPKDTLLLMGTELQLKYATIVSKLGNVNYQSVEQKPDGGVFSFLVGTQEYYIPQEEEHLSEEDIQKIKEEITYLEGFLKSVNGKLSNAKFVDNAPAKVVEIEKQKKADAEDKLAKLQAQLL